VDDRERAIRWYHDDQGDVNGLAAEFAAVRAPLERRVAQLEAALRECIEYCEGIQTPPPWMEQCRAALAGGTGEGGEVSGPDQWVCDKHKTCGFCDGIDFCKECGEEWAKRDRTHDAAVRLPLERRVAQLEAALRRLIAFALDHPEMDCAWYRVSMVETDVASAALAGAPEREGANG